MNISESIYSRSPTLLQDLLIPNFCYKPHQKRHTDLYNQLSKDIEDIKEFSAQKIRAPQEERQHLMVTYCAPKTPYHHTLFAELELTLNYITTVQDQERLPVLNK